jgi:NAD(P)-dependent dehydrogenase (short-subunit alcohol dehydrogenase family)
VPCPSRNRRHRSPRHRSPGLCRGMRTEPPSPRQPALAGSASRHVITTWAKSARTTPAPRPTTTQQPRRHHAVLRAYLPLPPALSHLVRILGLELRPHGIRVTAVAPQLLDTSRNRTVFLAEVLAHAVHRKRPRTSSPSSSATAPHPSAVRSCQPAAPSPAHHTCHLPCIRFVLEGNNDVIYEPFPATTR